MERMQELAAWAKISAFEGYPEDLFIAMMKGESEAQQRFALEKYKEYRLKFALMRQGQYKRAKGSPYFRFGTLPVEFVLANAGKQNVKTPFGVHDCFCSWRIMHYARKGIRCVECGMDGTFFALEAQNDVTTRYHLNLYHLHDHGGQTMITVDHILAKADGGTKHPDNLQTMCAPHNFKKGSVFALTHNGRAA